MKIISITWSNSDHSTYKDTLLYQSFINRNSANLIQNFHFNISNDNLLLKYQHRFHYQYEYIYYKIVKLYEILCNLTDDIYLIADSSDVVCLSNIDEFPSQLNNVIFSSEKHQYPNKNFWNNYPIDHSNNFLNSGLFIGEKQLLLQLLDFCIKNILPLDYKDFGGDQGVYTYAYLNSKHIILDNGKYFLSTYGSSVSDYFLENNRIVDQKNNKPLFIHDNGWNYGSPKFIESFNLI